MAEVVYDLEDGEKLTVNLREPHWAALLAWLWPGAGHFYQRRFAKGFVYMTCVLSIYFLGLLWGTSRVVYASFKSEDFRWQYLCQVGVGVPAFPAIVQSMVVGNGSDPWWEIARRHPAVRDGSSRNELLRESYQRLKPGQVLPAGQKPIIDGFMAPPGGESSLSENDVLGMWHFELGHFFEIGTVYTLVAGLLNMLAIYDAFVGPMILTPQEKAKKAAVVKEQQ
jgi:hypothetical protein